MKRLGWPFSNIYLCAGAGAVIGIALAFLRAHRERRNAEQLAELAQRQGFTLSEDVSRQDLSVWLSLPILQKWIKARNRLSGTKSGLHFEMLDVTSRDRDGENESSNEQTIVLVTTGCDLPAFELRPRTFGLQMLKLIGIEGISFSSEGASPPDAEAIEQFNKHYYLSTGLEDESTETAGTAAPKSTEHEAAIRRLFSLDLIRFFAYQTGWCVQSANRRLAIWQPGRVVPPDDRPLLLHQALAVGEALENSGQKSASTIPIPADPRFSTELTNADVTGAGIGGVGGFLIGGVLGAVLAGLIFFNFANINGLGFFLVFFLSAGAFFGGAFGGLILGLLLGRRVLSGPIESVIHRREQRFLADHSAQPNARTVADKPPKRARGAGARRQQRGPPRWFWYVHGSLFLIVGCAFLYGLAVRPAWGMLRATHWVETPCTIVSSGLVERSPNNTPMAEREPTTSPETTYRIGITYTYEFKGQPYQGNRYDFVMMSSNTNVQKRRGIVQQYSPGRQTVCFVNPSNPSDAVLHRGWSPDLWWGLFPVPFVAIGLVELILVVRSRRNVRT